MAKDPDGIERDIERSRAQLAEAIDAIADRVSPRRVASRGTDKAKARLEPLRRQLGSLAGSASGAGRPAIGGGTPAGRAGAPADRLSHLLGQANALLSSSGTKAAQLVRRKDPAALGAAVTALTLLALALRHRRR